MPLSTGDFVHLGVKELTDDGSSLGRGLVPAVYHAEDRGAPPSGGDITPLDALTLKPKAAAKGAGCMGERCSECAPAGAPRPHAGPMGCSRRPGVIILRRVPTYRQSYRLMPRSTVASGGCIGWRAPRP